MLDEVDRWYAKVLREMSIDERYGMSNSYVSS